VAACGVVVLHAYRVENALHSPLRLGAAGVDIFFVISGFIMAHVSRGKTAREFLTDRFWRIYPLWFVAMSPVLIVDRPAWPTTLSSLTLWPIYGTYVDPVLKVGWTLGFEMIFYLAMALAIVTRPLVPLAMFGLFLLLGLATRLPLFEYLGNPMIFEFLMGVGIARLRVRRFGLLAIGIALAAFAFSPLSVFWGNKAVLDPGFAMLRLLVWGVPAALLVYGTVQLEELFASKLFDLPVALGDASYSIYLFHGLVMVMVLFLNWAVTFVIGVAVSVGLSYLVERPILRLRPRGRPQPTATLARASGPTR
jgi:exopolysaccharide production protein ExoZ